MYHYGAIIFWKIIFLTHLILNIFLEFEKMYIYYSPSLHQDLYQKLIECFSNYIPINKIPIILNVEEFDMVFHEFVNDKYFEKSERD